VFFVDPIPQPDSSSGSSTIRWSFFGDWVTIAVVAERGPIRVSRAPVALGPGEARDADSPDVTAPIASVPPSVRNSKKPNNNKDQLPTIAELKYVNLTLIDFGANGKKGTSRGDAALSLLLLESDSYDTVSRGGNLLPDKMRKGGSRSAFEVRAKLREGSVVNPRVLKPLQVPSFVYIFSSR
jgi:minichromosome maintenance protein 10